MRRVLTVSLFPLRALAALAHAWLRHVVLSCGVLARLLLPVRGGVCLRGGLRMFRASKRVFQVERDGR